MTGGLAAKEGDGLGALIGLEHLEAGPERARARVEVTDAVRQPYGIVHGGAYAVIAESVCSRATHAAVIADGLAAMAQANQATCIRPISSGHINAEATVRHRGRTTWVWDCELSDDEGRLCALVRMTIAVRKQPPTPPLPP
jgi:1,4-dihydroxy-2-naphthoyl-CoA hydrolase